MLKQTLQKFKKLPTTTQSMIYLSWIYEFIQVITSTFLGAFVFIQTNSIAALCIYLLIFYLACMIGFCVWGYTVSQLKMSMKWNYFKAFFIYFLSFIFLLFYHTGLQNLLIFSFLNGLALGMFWVGVHSFEMIHTHKNNRDFYSSMVSAGSQTMHILAPLIATISFIASEYIFQIETFLSLFFILPFVFIFSIPFIGKLPDFIPPYIPVVEIKRLFSDKKLSVARKYYLAGAPGHTLKEIFVPVLALVALGNITNIGIFETIMGVISIIFVIYLSHHRHEGNRISILLYASFSYLVACSFLFFSDVHPIFYIIFSLIYLLSSPIHRVSVHVIDLESLEIIKTNKESCFYPGLLYRDFLLWISRSLMLIIVLITSQFTENALLAAKVSIILFVCSLFLTWFYAMKLMESRKI
ncbi:hypothetical protein HON22_04205 [Candidatus Peregrinibacteria bacterium]|jgi:MFS family permease|nr:hypothetical protein [Candidatus Peregrinibacteria bacterium]